MSVILKIWKDPVWSKVISAVILAIGAWIGVRLASLKWTETVAIPLWVIAPWAIYSVIAALWISRVKNFGIGRAGTIPVDKPPEESRAEIKIPFSEVALDTPLRIRFEFFGRRDGGASTGKDEWDGTYLAAFKLIGPKLRLEPIERIVKSSFSKALAFELGYGTIHIVDHDFQAMKIRLENFGVIHFGKGERSSHWCLTENGIKFLSKIHQ